MDESPSSRSGRNNRIDGHKFLELPHCAVCLCLEITSNNHTNKGSVMLPCCLLTPGESVWAEVGGDGAGAGDVAQEGNNPPSSSTAAVSDVGFTSPAFVSCSVSMQKSFSLRSLCGAAQGAQCFRSKPHTLHFRDIQRRQKLPPRSSSLSYTPYAYMLLRRKKLSSLVFRAMDGNGYRLGLGRERLSDCCCAS